MVQNQGRSDIRCDFRTGKVPFPLDCAQISRPVCDGNGLCGDRDVWHRHHHKNRFHWRTAYDFSTDRLFSIQRVHLSFRVEQYPAYSYDGSRRDMAVFHYVHEPFALPAYTVSLPVHTVRRG